MHGCMCCAGSLSLSFSSTVFSACDCAISQVAMRTAKARTSTGLHRQTAVCTPHTTPQRVRYIIGVHCSVSAHRHSQSLIASALNLSLPLLCPARPARMHPTPLQMFSACVSPAVDSQLPPSAHTPTPQQICSTPLPYLLPSLPPANHQGQQTPQASHVSARFVEPSPVSRCASL